MTGVAVLVGERDADPAEELVGEALQVAGGRALWVDLGERLDHLAPRERRALAGEALGAVTPRDIVWIGAAIIATAGLVVSALFVRDTAEHVALEQRDHGAPTHLPLRRAFAEASVRSPVLRACSQAGLVNNLNDALAWGLVPLYLAAEGASAGEIGVVAALYPAVWGAGQIGTGWLSDLVGRKPLIVAGMLVQAGALGLLAAGGGAVGPAAVAAILLGVGTALVYPTLIAAVSDAVTPSHRAPVVGVYRFWRDFGFVLGALLAGLVADALGSGPAITVVALLTGASGMWVAVTGWSRTRPLASTTPLGAG